jgi:hypothetical protein
VAKSPEILEVRKHVEVSVGTLASGVRAGASRSHKRSAAIAFTEAALGAVQIVGHARS